MKLWVVALLTYTARYDICPHRVSPSFISHPSIHPSISIHPSLPSPAFEPIARNPATDRIDIIQPTFRKGLLRRPHLAPRLELIQASWPGSAASGSDLTRLKALDRDGRSPVWLRCVAFKGAALFAAPAPASPPATDPPAAGHWKLVGRTSILLAHCHDLLLFTLGANEVPRLAHSMPTETSRIGSHNLTTTSTSPESC